VTPYGGEAWAGKSGEKMGRVAPGYLADVLLVDGNPLHDLSLLQDRNALLAIMKDGQFHKSGFWAQTLGIFENQRIQ